jgi:oryzin
MLLILVSISLTISSKDGKNTKNFLIKTAANISLRATWGSTLAENSTDSDAFGHGTHVAGTIASKDYGIAKKASIIAVKVLGDDGSGSNSDVIAGIQWAANDVTKKGRVGKAVANMSLGGGFSQATNDAVDAAVKAG